MSHHELPSAQQLADLIRSTGAVINPPLVKGWYAPFRDAQSREGAQVRADIAYGDDERQKLDVYLPTAQADSAQTNGRPLLLFVHGGGFVRGDRRERANVGWRFARAGFVTVLPSYRLGPQNHWPSGAQDAAAAWAWAHANAEALGADPQRIYLAGESAGAAHVAAATLIQRLRPASVPGPRAALLVSGVYNVHLEKLARRQFGVPSPDPRNEAYFGSDFASYPAMSTVELIDSTPFPLLVTWAELDPPQMQIQAGELFARLVTQHGFDPDVAVIPGHNHLSQLEAINTVDDILALTLLDFMRRH
ncbi:acetyl esterase/lipase [Paraburkholderia bannensis]|uniref:Acetyl esterase/lipase n=1 Tax=Paraburkholderia bannensis TaxID=765414 RepID=A0A7W9WUA9_9BURK|nr:MULTISPECIES: alpha/beta hydrolase [Paraburkholderia]MBB3258620.1 acetyl esterase/lipase [Paraburkholderia sp. WP4_3_2]MBB6103633.1 acetyl esterase/lipase [Paraburkholderia bannensis]